MANFLHNRVIFFYFSEVLSAIMRRTELFGCFEMEKKKKKWLFLKAK